MSDPCIDIVLATFNGEQYVEQQISSIIHSHCYDELVKRIIVVDDGSSDRTGIIVKELSEQDSKIEWHPNTSDNSGALGNFTYGLSLVTSVYIMLCDQDDVWHPSKIKKSYDAIENLNKSMPRLVFTDKRIVNENLEVISDSFYEYLSIPKKWHESIERLLQYNVASGCTMMFDQALLKKATPIPKNAYMHDWWLILIAKMSGEVFYIDESLIDYRQHNNNVVGAKSYSAKYLLTHFNQHLSRFEENFWRSVVQSELLSCRLQSQELKDIPFVSFNKYSYVGRISLFFRGKLIRHSMKGKLALLVTIILNRSMSK